MISYLQVENLTKSFGDNVLFQNINFGIGEGDKIGLIAKNGSGKSTLLNIISGREGYDSGSVIFKNDLRYDILEQAPNFNHDLTILEACLSGNDKISIALKHYEDALLSNNKDEITKSIQIVDELNAWDYETRFKQILTALKFDDLSKKIGVLSGGEIKRIAIAKILINEPQFVILDEPTNHLDVDTIEWLEDYLSHSKMTILMVTHDRYFLDSICTKIIELDNQTIFTYDGNYNYYLEKRAERIEAHEAETARAKNLYRKELDWMRRQPQARAGKARYRIDSFYDLEKRVKERRDARALELNIKSSYIGSKIFEAKSISKKFDNKIILSDFNYTFARYEKLGIVGNNGVGKSTFIKLLLGHLIPDSGFFDVGETVNFGYYSQEGIAFNESKKVIDAIKEIAEYIYFDEKNKYSASQFLKLFLFSPADQQKPIAKLSGGEKRRLYLATILIKQPNFLILDEPTNDLDIVTLEVLEDYLYKFKGCLIIISHDRFFMDRTVDHILVFEGNGTIKDFPGNYTDYRMWNESQKSQNQKISKPQKSEPKTSVHSIKNKLSYKERKEFEQLTIELENLNKEKDELFNLFNSGETIPDIINKSNRFEQLKAIIDEKEFRWLELSEKE